MRRLEWFGNRVFLRGVSALLWVFNHVWLLCLLVVFCYPFAMALVISAMLLDPRVPDSLKGDIPSMISTQFVQLFQYGVVMSIFLALSMLVYGGLEGMRHHLRNRLYYRSVCREYADEAEVKPASSAVTEDDTEVCCKS